MGVERPGRGVVGAMNERAKVLLEVATWAGRKRDGAIVVPWTLSRYQEGPWRDGYYTAMNEVAQHFNMERFTAENDSRYE